IDSECLLFTKFYQKMPQKEGYPLALRGRLRYYYLK
ncbi:MAG: hypothetical protein RLZZ338_1805, partial [Cyanobacteriota bacterium]